MEAPKILNVDDYAPSRYARTRLLQAYGFDVAEAATGHEALRLAASEDPALVLLDVNLPDMNGFEVCRRLKHNSAGGLLPVLHVSATFTDSKHRVLALDTGADGYLTEPIDPPVLLATINALLRMKRAEMAMRVAAREWQATFDAISDGICLLDADGAIVRFNAALARFFPELDVLLGRHVTTLWDLPPDRVESLPVMRMRRTRRQETDEFLRGGRWIRITVHPLVNGDAVSGAVYVVSDITEWKRLEAERADLLRREQSARAEAETASRAKDEFLAMLSHELRNPLAPIQYAMSAIAPQAAREPAVAHAKDVVDRQVKHLGRLVDDLVDVARLTRRQIELRMEVVVVQQIVADALDAMRPILEAHQHRLSVSLADAPLHVNGDSTRLAQVVSNLLNNAAKYTPAGGEVQVTVARQDDEVAVRIRDSGVGMPADLLPHVFEMFTRGDPSTTGGQSGLGLGLTIADSIVAAHGGILTAHSPGPGQGSEFVVRLPLSRPDGVLGPLPTVSAPVVASPRILVVDDSEDTREILTVLLELEGYRVAAVSSGQEAVERAVRGEAEIVVIDIGLPDLDGSEVARRIRAARGNDVHIIALTGYGGREDSHRFMDAGFDAHLLKPVSTDELLRAVRSGAHRS